MRIVPNNTTRVSTAPDTGQRLVQISQGQWWELEAEVAPMKQNGSADDWAAFLTACMGQGGTFRLGDSSRKLPRGTAARNSTALPAVSGGSQTGNTLVTQGWLEGSQIFKAGDYFQLGGSNMVLRSQEFTNAVWVKTNCSVFADAETAPDGSSTADLCIPSGSGEPTIHQDFTPYNAGQAHNGSFWVASADGSDMIVEVLLYIGGTLIKNSIFSLTNSGAWTRVSTSANSLDMTAHRVMIKFYGPTGDPDKQIYLWNGQVNPGYSPDPEMTTVSSVIHTPPRLHKVLTTVHASGSGTASLEIFPRLRESPANGSRLKTSNAQGLFSLTSDASGWDVDKAKLYGVGITAREAY